LLVLVCYAGVLNHLRLNKICQWFVL
jgi:hypothetical protein